MELRKHINKPTRYREDSNEPKKKLSRPIEDYEARPFIPDLRPACFPTLTLDQDCPNDSASTNNSLEPERPALVFRDPRVQRDENGNMVGPKPALEPLIANSWDFDPVEDLEPGEFDGFDVEWVDEEGNELPRSPLPALVSRVEWEHLSEGIQLVIIREFTREMKYQDVADFLQINLDSLKAFARLMEREFLRYLEADIRMNVCIQKQDALTAIGNYTNEEWDACTNEMVNGIDPPAAFTISNDEAELATRFLLDFRYREEFPEKVELAPGDQDFRDGDDFDYNSIPSYEIWSNVINSLLNSVGTMTSETDLDFKAGICNIFQDTQMALLDEEEYRKLYDNEGNDSILESDQEGKEPEPEHPRVRKSPPRKASSIAKPFYFISKTYGGPLSGIPEPVGKHQQLPKQPPPQQPKKVSKKKTGSTRPASKPQGVTKKQPSTSNAASVKARTASRAPSRLREVTNTDDLDTPNSSDNRPATATAAATRPTPTVRPAQPQDRSYQAQLNRGQNAPISYQQSDRAIRPPTESNPAYNAPIAYEESGPLTPAVQPSQSRNSSHQPQLNPDYDAPVVSKQPGHVDSSAQRQ